MPYSLASFADDEEREPGRERGGGRERHGAELRPGKPVDPLPGDRVGDPATELSEQLGLGLEAVLVEVVARPAAGAQDEVTLKVRPLSDPPSELGVVHPRALASALRPSGMSRSPGAVDGASETIEPSSK